MKTSYLQSVSIFLLCTTCITKTSIAKPIVDVGPVRVVITRDNYEDNEAPEFTLDEIALRRVLEKDDIKNLPVVVISIAGDFRKGKSFLLNFFLRYLQAKSEEGKTSWLWDTENSTDNNKTDTDRHLKGFQWKIGAEGHTSGVLLWSQVFKIKNKANEDVAVILMDTQGTSDNENSDKECTTIFALSTMLSSVQIYNLKENINKKDLDHLQFFANYGMQVLHAPEDKPFQTLYFLIRDWSAPRDHPYGKEGGQQLIDKRLRVTNKIDESEKSGNFQVARNIKNYFDTISCFLMPHPGKIVATSPDFHGALSDIDPEFLKNVKEFVEDILAPQNLVTKRVSGQEVRVKDLMNYFRAYVKLFNGDKLPRIQSLTHANAEANLASAVGKVEDDYRVLMAGVLNEPRLNMDLLKSEHDRAKDKAMKQFESAENLGRKTLQEDFHDNLIKKIDDMLADSKLELETRSVEQHEIAFHKAIEFYNQHMLDKYPPSEPYIPEPELLSEHREIKKRAVDQFNETPKWDEEKHAQSYQTRLKENLEDLYPKFKEANDKKWNILIFLKSLLWPTLLAVAISMGLYWVFQVSGSVAVAFARNTFYTLMKKLLRVVFSWLGFGGVFNHWF